MQGNMARVKRVSKEYQQLLKEPVEGIEAAPVSDSDICNWKAKVQGPPDSPYQNGKFHLSIHFPDNYPFKPPVLKFVTKIWHPNVGCEGNPGHICLDILQSQWSPALSISKVLLSLISLLTDPNCASPMNGEAAQQYKSNRSKYDATVREWVEKYAERVEVKPAPRSIKTPEPEPTRKKSRVES